MLSILHLCSIIGLLLYFDAWNVGYTLHVARQYTFFDPLMLVPNDEEYVRLLCFLLSTPHALWFLPLIGFLTLHSPIFASLAARYFSSHFLQTSTVFPSF